jgi:ubiquinone/menaquinone biosynthesis C-methylase UbiE
MIDLKVRSSLKEIMDRDDIPFPAIAQTLKELNVVNARLGGHSITLDGARHLLMDLQKRNSAVASPTICEIGCGGGDNLFAIYKHYKKNNIPVKFIGIDLNPECIAFAKQQYPQLPCEWICSDYAAIQFYEKKPDLIFSSLFCHHFSNGQLVFMLRWLRLNSEKGFFINDLHRHWLAYYLIKYITRFFSKSYLVKNDASISVARGFRRNDWKQLFKEAGMDNYSISWKWAFRYLVLYRNPTQDAISQMQDERI